MTIRRYDLTTAAIACDGCNTEIRREIEPASIGWRKDLRLEATEVGWATRTPRNGRHRDFCEDCKN